MRGEMPLGGSIFYQKERGAVAIDSCGNKISVGDWVVAKDHVFRIGKNWEWVDDDTHDWLFLKDVVRLRPYKFSGDAKPGDRVAFIGERPAGFPNIVGASGRVVGVKTGFIAWIPDGCEGESIPATLYSSGRQLAKIPNIEAPKEDEPKMRKQTEYDVPNPMLPGLYVSGNMCCEVMWNTIERKYIVRGRNGDDEKTYFEKDQLWTGLGSSWVKQSDWQSRKKPVNIGWDPL